MTDRAEIERLLNQTGRTLEGLPKGHSEEERTNALSTFVPWGEVICQQSDVIELLVGALRDALDKPMRKPFQKPLTHKEAEDLLNSGVRVWIEERGHYEEPEGVNSGHLMTGGYNARWRCWASRPTDEEREAAEWES